jgi:NDP-sugar pyrophosphorylase family protein
VSASAILLVGSRSLVTATWDGASLRSESEQNETPVGCSDVVGASIVERTCERLKNAGVKRVFVAVPDFLMRFVPRGVRKLATLIRIRQQSGEQPALDRLFLQECAKGAEAVVIMRAAAYTEFDLHDILQFHNSHGARSTRVCDCEGPLDFWVLSSGRLNRNERLSDLIAEAEDSSYYLSGYVNRLANPADLRRLVVDAFHGRCDLKPHGREVRPGVWVARGAHIHACARIVAPAYVGRKSRVCASALITRFSTLEHGSFVGPATVVENSSVLPFTYVGSHLDISNAVVDGNKLAHLGRNVTVRIQDAKLIHRIDPWHFLKVFVKSASPAQPVREAGQIRIVPSISAAAPAYVNSSKEQYDNWESCNR